MIYGQIGFLEESEKGIVDFLAQMKKIFWFDPGEPSDS